MQLVIELAGPFLQPNVVADRAETEWRRVQAQGAVPALLGYVKKDELIVDANQKLTREALDRLRSLDNLEAARREPRELLYPPLARALLMLLFMAAFATYLRMELPAVYRDNAMLALFALLTAIVVAAAEALVGRYDLPVLVVPLAAAPLVTASVLEKRPAVVFTLMLAVMVTAVSELKAPFVAMAVMGGVTAVYSVARLRHRWHFAVAAFFIAFANLFAILTWDLGQQPKPEVLAQDAGWGVAGAFLSVALAYLLLPVAEHLFGLTSDITLLELSDLNRPLLKRLQLEAPGTYHHSMVVGSLAERAAEAIGANSLLARVSAYYHDIGKLAKPEYFNENIPPHVRNPHEKLSPNMSTLVVRSHLNEGIEMARREHLPRAVRAAIPEHHGTMTMALLLRQGARAGPGGAARGLLLPRPAAALARDRDPDARRRRRGRLARALGADPEPHPRARDAQHRGARAAGAARRVRADAAGAGEDPRGLHPGADRHLPRAGQVPRDPAARRCPSPSLARGGSWAWPRRCAPWWWRRWRSRAAAPARSRWCSPTTRSCAT